MTLYKFKGFFFNAVIGTLFALCITNWSEAKKITNSINNQLDILKQNLIEDLYCKKRSK